MSVKEYCLLILIGIAVLSLLTGFAVVLLVAVIVICAIEVYRLTVYVIHVHLLRLVNRLIFITKRLFKND